MSHDDETGVRNWLRQQSEDLCAAGFDALAKRRGNSINFDGGYVEKWKFLPGSGFMICIHL
jgi:hypothetical protein